METGQVGICLDGTRGWPRVIEKVTGSRAHHVVVALSPTECLSPEAGGARIRPMSDFTNTIWSKFEMTDDQRAHVSRLGRSLEGHPYNYVAFVLVGVQFFTRNRVPAWVVQRVANMRAAECAQMADWILSAAGVHVFRDGRDPGVVYPGSWETLFLRRGWA